MPALRRKFRKFYEDDAEGMGPAGKETTKAAPRIKAFRNPFFQPLLEDGTPSSLAQDGAFSEWKDIAKDTPLNENDENTVPAIDWPEVRNPHEDTSKNLPQVLPKQNETKIPQLKGNKLDDVRHNRAKELLLEVGKEKNVDPFIRQADSTKQKKAVDEVTSEISGWNPFETASSDTLHASNPQESPGSSTWESFGSSPMLKSKEGSILLHDDLDMPATLNFNNLLEQPRESIEKSKHSDIVSVENKDQEDGENVIFLTLDSDLKASTEASRIDRLCDRTFSLGLETVNESMEDEGLSPSIGSNIKNRRSIFYERNELLSPALLLNNTPKGVTKEVNESADQREENRQRQLTMDKIVEAEESLHDCLAGDNSICDSTSPVPEDNIKTSEETTGDPKGNDSNEKRTESNVPVDVRVVGRESSFESVKHRIMKKNSIHFNARPSPSSHNSLLDTEGDVSDPVCGLYTSASSDSTTDDSRVDIIIDAGSFNSASLSTMTYPRNLKLCDDSVSQSSEHDPRYPQKRKTKPLGASAQEIELLNKFLMVAGPKLSSPDLSMEEREAIHSKAIKAGLPELFVNKILDQTAGIIRWEEQSVGTLLTSESTDDEFSRHERSVYSSDSYSTRYTQDNESISYHSYSRRTQTPKEASGVYGCLGNLNTSFWSELERGLTGDDMMENISAALSGSFDGVSRPKQSQPRK